MLCEIISQGIAVIVYGYIEANHCYWYGTPNSIEDNLNEDLWPYGYIDSGLTDLECDNVKNNSDEDGKNNPFDQDRNQACSDYDRAYYNGFIDGCASVEGITRET